GQRDEHIRAARPNVQGMRLETMRAVGIGSDGQLFVTVVEILLRKIKSRQPKHLVPNRGSSAIRAYDYVRFDSLRLAGSLIVEVEHAGFEVEPSAALIEMDPNTARFSFVHQGDIEIRT